MVQRSSNDIASQYCERINRNASHLRCKFCEHTMWGGMTRFRNHLAGTRSDVTPCRKCPPEVAQEMTEQVVNRLLDGVGRKRQRTESLENMRNAEAQVHPPSPPQEGESKDDVDVEAEEKDLIEQAIQESLKTHEIEKKKTKIDEDEFEVACFESMRSYQEERQRRGEGCSRYQGGSSSHAADYENIKIETDSDIEFGFC